VTERAQAAEAWCDRECDFHWRVSIGSGPLIILKFDGSCGEAYLSPDEADAIGDALKAYASEARRPPLHPGDGYSMAVRSLVIESHDGEGLRQAADAPEPPEGESPDGQ
jgi:hypothetical protein